MAGYAHLYQQEREAHAKTRRDLIALRDFVRTIRGFILEKDLHEEVLEWVLRHHMGDERAEELMAKMDTDTKQRAARL